MTTISATSSHLPPEARRRRGFPGLKWTDRINRPAITARRTAMRMKSARVKTSAPSSVSWHSKRRWSYREPIGNCLRNEPFGSGKPAECIRLGKNAIPDCKHFRELYTLQRCNLTCTLVGELCYVATRTDRVQTNLLKRLAIPLLVLCIAATIWPSYRKFFINEWRDRIVRGQPVVFVPECPAILAQIKCGDRYTLVFRKNANDQWCSRVRKNEDRKSLNPAALMSTRGILPGPGDISPSKAFGCIIPGEGKSSRPTRAQVG